LEKKEQQQQQQQETLIEKYLEYTKAISNCFKRDCNL